MALPNIGKHSGSALAFGLSDSNYPTNLGVKINVLIIDKLRFLYNQMIF